MCSDSTPSKAKTRRIAAYDADETEAIGLAIGAHLQPPICVALSGELGAGKTTITRGIVEGVQEGEGEFVASPTYNVCHVYRTAPPIHHYDLYRIESEDDLESVGFYDSLDAGILIIEWPEKVASVAGHVDITVRLQARDDGGRDITLEARTPKGRATVGRILDAR